MSKAIREKVAQSSSVLRLKECSTAINWNPLPFGYTDLPKCNRQSIPNTNFSIFKSQYDSTGCITSLLQCTCVCLNTSIWWLHVMWGWNTTYWRQWAKRTALRSASYIPLHTLVTDHKLQISKHLFRTSACNLWKLVFNFTKQNPC